jgi:hypothetical protein
MLHMLHVLHMLHGLRSALLPEAGFGTQVWTRGPFHVGAVGAFVAHLKARGQRLCVIARIAVVTIITLIQARGSSQTLFAFVAVILR